MPTDAQRQAVLGLAARPEGCHLSAVMTGTGLNRTNSLSLLLTLEADGSLRATFDRTARHKVFRLPGAGVSADEAGRWAP